MNEWRKSGPDTVRPCASTCYPEAARQELDRAGLRDTRHPAIRTDTGEALKAIQQYEPEELSDANLEKIQAEFDKIPAK